MSPSPKSSTRSAKTAVRREYFKSCRRGGIAAGLLFAATLMTSGANFLGSSYTTRFYGAQAHSWLHGRWDIPKSVLGIEGFQTGSRWYMYYGPLPALIRLPFVALGWDIERKLTQLAMLTAFGLTLFFSARLSWRIRYLINGDAPLGRFESTAVTGALFVIGAGSALLFLASQAWVYHEAEIWGAALAIGAFDAILASVLAPTARRIALASGLAAGAVLSRASVGFGPIVALALLACAISVKSWRARFATAPRAGSRLAAGYALAAAAPLILYATTNWLKFRNFFVFPTGRQLMSQLNPHRQAFLSRSGGSYFSAKFIPTTIVQYFRPDALRFRWFVPWLDFPNPPRAFGGQLFDVIEPTSSVPSSMPALTMFAIVGVVVVFRRRSRLNAMRPLLIGGAVGGLGVLPFGYVAQRYLADFVPLVVVAALAGFQLLVQQRPYDGRWRRWLWTAAALLAGASVIINVALAVNYHYTTNWNPEELVAPYVKAQYALYRQVSGPANAETGSHLPYPPRPRGTIFVVGNCIGVYRSPGDVPALAWAPWQGIARTRASGEYRLRVRFDRARRITFDPLVVRGSRGRVQMIGVKVLPRGLLRFTFISEGHDNLPSGSKVAGRYFIGPAWKYDPGIFYDITVVMDPFSGTVRVEFNGRTAFRFYQFELTPAQQQHYVFATTLVAIGRNDTGVGPAGRRFHGELRQLPDRRPAICDDLRF